MSEANSMDCRVGQPAPEKKKPTGFVAICQCGVAVGALDLVMSDRRDVARLLGAWLMDGCVVHPQFGGGWAAYLEPCKCGQQPNTISTNTPN
jgi:hypothetical protein